MPRKITKPYGGGSKEHLSPSAPTETQHPSPAGDVRAEKPVETLLDRINRALQQKKRPVEKPATETPSPRTVDTSETRIRLTSVIHPPAEPPVSSPTRDEAKATPRRPRSSIPSVPAAPITPPEGAVKAPQTDISALAARIQARFLNSDGSLKLGVSPDMLQRFVRQEEVAAEDLTAALALINSGAEASIKSAQPESSRRVSIETIALKIQARFLNPDGAFRKDISPLDLENFIAQEGLGGTDLSAALSYINSLRQSASEAPPPATDPEPPTSAGRGSPTSPRRGLPIILEPGHSIAPSGHTPGLPVEGAPDVSPVPIAPVAPPERAARPSPAPRGAVTEPTPPPVRRVRRAPVREAAATAFPSSGRTTPQPAARRVDVAPETFPVRGLPDYSAPRRPVEPDTSPRIPVLQPGLDSEGQKEQAEAAARAHEERRKAALLGRLKTELPKTAITAVLSFVTRDSDTHYSPGSFRINPTEVLQGLTGRDFDLVMSGVNPEDIASVAREMLLKTFSDAWDRAVVNKPISDREAEIIGRLHHFAVSGTPKKNVLKLLENHLSEKATNLSKVRAPRTNDETPGVNELVNL